MRRSSRKRKMEIDGAVDKVEDERDIKTGSKELPVEVWKIVLTGLRHDFKSLLKCRLVSNQFRILSDEVLKENSSLWRTTFSKDFAEFQKSSEVNGTRFSSPDKLIEFTARMQNVRWNPFPNGTVIFSPAASLNDDGKKRFYEAFNDFIPRFQDHILSLIYTFKAEDDGIDCFLQFFSILKLRNLRSLVIHKDSWKFLWTAKVNKLMKELAVLDNFPVPSNLTEMQLFGDLSCHTLFYVIANFGQVMKSVTHVSFNFLFNMHPIYQTVLEEAQKRLRHHLPKLRKLKLVGPDKLLVEHYCNSSLNNGCPPLKEISIRFPFRSSTLLTQAEVMAAVAQYRQNPNQNNNIMGSQHKLGKKVPEVINALDCQAHNLELFQLDIDKEILLFNPNPDMNPQINCNVKFPKLKTLILQFTTVSNWRSLIRELKQKFDAVEVLVLLLESSDIQGKTPKTIYANAQRCWNLFPDSLNEIQVPYYAWHMRRGEEKQFEYY